MKNSNALILVIVAVFAGIMIGNALQQQVAEVDYSYTAPSTQGYTKVAVDINYTTVHLSDECHDLSFDVTQDQAYAIARGLERTVGPRPLTQDIMKDVLDNFDIEIIQIRIDRYENEIYYATIFLRQGNRVLELDARPSDSIALALRTGTQLYFKQSILADRGAYVCVIGG
jgi:bifunctional DNase/RNase